MEHPPILIALAEELIRLHGLEPDKDVPIVFTGVRPGEKLQEEILTAEEGTEATKHKQIFLPHILDQIHPRKYNDRISRRLKQRKGANDMTVATKYGIALIGPNCLGIINTDPGVSLNATFARSMPPRGNIAFVSQSDTVDVV